MLENKISPSMMCVDFAEIVKTIQEFEQSGIEYLHMDVMDGEFVPNFTLGVDFCKKLRQMTNIPLDLHLMIQKPDEKVEWFDIQPGEYVGIHYESTIHMQRLLSNIRSKGAKPMVVLNPGTPITVMEEILDDIDGVLLMTVNPGYAGQQLVPSTIEKIKKLRKYLDEHNHSNIEIEVDGNVSFENTVKMRAAGANIFVGGSSSVFSSTGSITENIAKMRALLK